MSGPHLHSGSEAVFFKGFLTAAYCTDSSLVDVMWLEFVGNESRTAGPAATDSFVCSS